MIEALLHEFMLQVGKEQIEICACFLMDNHLHILFYMIRVVKHYYMTKISSIQVVKGLNV